MHHTCKRSTHGTRSIRSHRRYGQPRGGVIGILLVVTLAVCTLCACESKDGDSAEEKSESEPTATKVFALEGTNLSVELPEDVKITPIENGGARIVTSDYYLAVQKPTKYTPKTLEDAKKRASMDFKHATGVEGEALADGYAVTFENARERGSNWIVRTRREIGGEVWTCGTEATSAEAQAGALEVCKALRAK